MEQALLKLPAYERFGPFDLLRPIDAGGMAEVVLARERLGRGQSRIVAVKRLLPHIEDDPVFVSMFRDEARLAKLVDHPGVVRAFSSGEVAGHPFIALEWIHGVSLAVLARALPGRIPVGAALRILAEVADAVDYTHRLRDPSGRFLEVVHRDITPSNVMVGFDGTTKILDFGLAKSTAQSCSTASGVVKGKLRYLAPEQVQEGAELTYRVDVFAIGLCLFEALAGRALFDQEDPLEAARSVAGYRRPPPLSTIRPDAPAAVDDVLRRLLEPSPLERVQTARKARALLDRLIAQTPPPWGPAEVGGLLRETFPVEAVALL